MEDETTAPTHLPQDSHSKRETSLSDHLEAVLEDLFGLFLRLLTTVVFLSLRPKQAAGYLSGESAGKRVLVSPYTFLLIGCLLYSYFLGGAVDISTSNLTQVVWKVLKKKLAEGFSLESVLIRSLPLLLGASLAAGIAGRVFKDSTTRVRTLFVYIYGLQGVGLLLFALSASALSTAFERLAGSDDYIILLFFALTFALGVQVFRCLRFLVHGAKGSRPTNRVFLYLAFPILYLAPMTAVGYGVVATGFIKQEVKKTKIEPVVPAVRIIDAGWQNTEDSGLSLSLTFLRIDRGMRLCWNSRQRVYMVNS